MEYTQRKQKTNLNTRVSTANSSQGNRFFLNCKSQIKKVKERPATGKKSYQPSYKKQKRKISTNVVQKIQKFERLYQKQTFSRFKKEKYLSKGLSLTQNSFIYDQDAFKLQNFITGGYNCDDEFMSLSKFNRTKDNFILLNEIYNKAKNQQRTNRLQKQKVKTRNIFSVVYLNQNLKIMHKKDEIQLLDRLKIVK